MTTVVVAGARRTEQVDRYRYPKVVVQPNYSCSVMYHLFGRQKYKGFGFGEEKRMRQGREEEREREREERERRERGKGEREGGRDI